MKTISTFREFYPYYLSQHTNPWCRLMHFTGTALALFTIGFAIATHRPALLVAAPLFGYGFSWIGHFGFERNKPAAFHAPWMSLLGDLRMFGEIVTFQRRIF